MQNPWIKTGALALSAFAIAACGGGSGGDDGGGNGGGNGGGGEPDTETRNQAAATASIASLFSKAGVSVADQANDMDDEATTQSLTMKAVEPCSAGGTIDRQPPANEDVGSPFASSLTITRTVATNCQIEQSGDGSPSTSFENGILVNGEAENGAVIYFRASDTGDNPASGEPYVLETSGSTPQGDFDISFVAQGELNICDNCASPTQGGTQEILGYADFSFSGGSFPGAPEIPAISTTFGDGPDNPVTLIAKDMGATTETTIDGPFGFDDGGACNFTSDYETISPLITDNSSGLTTGGQVNITTGGSTFDVVYNSDGSITVNGETYTVEELAELNQDCKSALSELEG